MIREIRRALLVSYWVPPRTAVGAIRCGHLIKYLRRFGWEVDVLTPRLADLTAPLDKSYQQTGYCDPKELFKRAAGIEGRSVSETFSLRGMQYGGKPGTAGRIVRAAAALMTYPDDYVGWLPFGVPALRRQLKRRAYDALLTSSPPWTTNVIAAFAHGRVPWIADMRDLWYEDDSRERSPMRMLIDDRLERTALRGTAALIASSALSAQRFLKRYPGKPCFGISTGFDEDEWVNVPFAAEEHCTLLYAGNFYRGRRDPAMLFQAIHELLNEGLISKESVRVAFYANPEPWLLGQIGLYGLGGIVQIRGIAHRKAVLEAERRADRLLVFSWDGATAEGVVPGKLFEYFGARRRVLALGGPLRSNVAELLAETGAGTRFRSTAHIKDEILAAVREHRNGAQIVPERAVSFYTAQQCALQFAQILDSVLAQRGAVTGMRPAPVE